MTLFLDSLSRRLCVNVGNQGWMALGVYCSIAVWRMFKLTDGWMEWMDKLMGPDAIKSSQIINRAPVANMMWRWRSISFT